MSSNSIVKISRDSVIESSYNVAIIKLNNFSHVPGQPVLVRYYDSIGRINSILAIGISDGPGKENYTIVSNGDIEPVTGVFSTRFPDASSLVNDEVYVCYDSSDKPAYCYLENNTKTFSPIVADKTFYSALDGFLWFVTGGKIRRSDSPFDYDTLLGLVQSMIDNGGITINQNRTVYTWAENPDGVVNEEYARVFDIPSGQSVIMSVTTTVGNNISVDIITYGKSVGSEGYNLTTRTNAFLAAKLESNNLPRGIVHPTANPSNAVYKFTVISSTCSEDQIQWFSAVGWNGPVSELTQIGGNQGSSINNLVSGDSSISITTENDQVSLEVSDSAASREFMWSKEAGLSTFSNQYSWIRVFDVLEKDNSGLGGIEFKCKELGVGGFFNIDFSLNKLYTNGSHEFVKAVQDNFEFAVEVLSTGYYFYARPVYSKGLKSFEVKVISSKPGWIYSSENYSGSGRSPYKTKNSALDIATIVSGTTSTLTEDSDKLITSGAVYSKTSEIESVTEDLVDRVDELEDSYVSSATLNNETINPVSGNLDLGTLYGPENTTVLNSDTEINGVLARRGSLVKLGSDGSYESIITLSSTSIFYKLIADSLVWWELGKVNGLGAIRVSISGPKLKKIVGDIWWTRHEKPVTNNESLSGYIKVGANNKLYVRGSVTHPFTVEIEDYQGEFVYSGTVVSSSSAVYNTIGVVRVDSQLNYLNINSDNREVVTDASYDYYFVSDVTDPVIDIEKSENTCDCFSFNVVFKDSESTSLTVYLILAGNTVQTLNLNRISVSPGVIYTVTYKQDEFIYSIKTDNTLPLTVSDLGVTVEAIENKVTLITSDSTDNQYPTAKATWNLFKGKVNLDFTKTSEYDSTNKYPYQAAFKVTTPAIIDVHWTKPTGTYSDTIYINGKPGLSSTYNIRCHNQLGVFSLRYYNGDFYVCIPAKSSVNSEAVTYNFVPSTIGTAVVVNTKLFFNSSVPSIFVGQTLSNPGNSIYNLDTNTSVTDFDFLNYDTILATVGSGNSISIKGPTLPGEDKIYTFINNTGRDLTNLYFEGRNSSNIISKINIPNVQEGAIVTLAYIAGTNTFDYNISLQEIISPQHTIDITRGVNQWKIDIDPEIIDKINTPVSIETDIDSGTRIATINGTEILIPSTMEDETLSITPTVTVGGIDAGVNLVNKTALEILTQMLTPYVAPKIASMSISVPVMLYGKTYSDIIISAVGKAGSRPVRSMTLDGSTYSDVVSLNKSKRIDTLTPRDSSINTITYQSSISDVDNVVGTGSASIQLVGGVFIFFSSSEELPTTNLDFITYGCQSERTEIKGIYENIYHEDDAYLYIVAPNTSKMEIKSIKSGGYVVPLDFIGTRTLKQGTGDIFVSLEMRVYRSDKKHNAGYFSCEINNPTI